jgi:hypothetical protein
MTPERRAELKQQCVGEPNLRATLADLEADLAPKLADVDALLHKKASLVSALAEIDGFKAELAAGAAELEPEPVAEDAAEESAADEAGTPAKKPRKHK